ncbi:MAG TPA: methyltransferase domain-containing protein [Acidimicrobiales bacterium]|nr:methyltransferase domain-containing protein [Acidimicrobiales bacterium]
MKSWVSSVARRLRPPGIESEPELPEPEPVDVEDVVAEPEPLPDPDDVPRITDDVIGFEVLQWTVWHTILRMRFEVEPRERGLPTHLILYFSNRRMEIPLEPRLSQSVEVLIPEEQSATCIPLAFRMESGELFSEPNPGARSLQHDPSGAVFYDFLEALKKMSAPRVLEIGSRARSGNTYRHFLPDDTEYVGVDVKEGPNVDVVADAHDLRAALGDQKFDAVFSISVFEHLAMPWKVAVSINQVLNEGGIVFVGTHQSFPLHDPPWDFWRFSDEAWKCLFNRATGFEVVEAALGEPAEMIALSSHPAVWRIEQQRAYFTSNALMRKVGESRVDWPVSMSDLEVGDYPA